MEINKQERTFPDRENPHHAASQQAFEYVKIFLNDAGHSLRHYAALPAFLAAYAKGLCSILLRSHGKRQPSESNE